MSATETMFSEPGQPTTRSKEEGHFIDINLKFYLHFYLPVVFSLVNLQCFMKGNLRSRN